MRIAATRSLSAPAPGASAALTSRCTSRGITFAKPLTAPTAPRPASVCRSGSLPTHTCSGGMKACAYASEASRWQPLSFRPMMVCGYRFTSSSITAWLSGTPDTWGM
ncbi:MAG: hypothetical protein AD742_12500 [Methylibium sp. NZG]|nr:MAG: hypothetical protein AD742_12500 [Methylibium sp. NZG]